MVTKVLKTREEYEEALAGLEALVDREPDPGTPDGNQLELLSLLIQDYEARKFAPVAPDPIEAIRFRMEQQGLSQRDLIPYIGSRSRVSEVLSGKRPLTLAMIRALHAKLGIPAKSLLGTRDPAIIETDVEWSRFPVREMAARGWLKASVADARDRAEELMRNFMEPLEAGSMIALYRKGHIRSGRKMDHYALAAWTTRILLQAKKTPTKSPYKPGSVTPAFMTELARLSWADTGPRLAIDLLAHHGIRVIVEKHLPQTHLDGAAVLIAGSSPVIGLSLRHDRIDNFWFCLMHELAHVCLHLGSKAGQFYDDLDSEAAADPREHEADDLAGEALVPRKEWENSPAKSLWTPEAAADLASRLRIHPAIVAGKMRHESKQYRILNQMVGHGEVRPLFPEVRWD